MSTSALAGVVTSAPARLLREAIPGIAVLVVAASGAESQEAVHSPHGALPDSLECSACHTPQGWHALKKVLAFRHGERSGFLLTGAHRSAACASCHTDLRFDGPSVRPDNCASCHTDVHEGRMLQECSVCHTTGGFGDVDGERIHARTSFPLTGAHRQVTCESCHMTAGGGTFTRLDPDCMSCHAKDYDGARTVDHVAAGFPPTCTVCHSTLSWSDTQTLDHAVLSGGFALRGAHTRLECASCHGIPGMTPLFQATSQDDCLACHQADFDREHAGTTFPTTCLSCHTLETWADLSRFDHGLSGFQLLGAHSSLLCTSCHAVPGYALLFPKPVDPNDCVACHESQFDAAHGGVGYPSTCATCHTVNAWLPSTFDHDAEYFRIYSGTHQGRWDTCATCHTVPGDFASFSCLVCHEHAKTTMDEHHQQVSGYVYDSNACYSCHRGGGGG